jgi:hypothetical protein
LTSSIFIYDRDTASSRRPIEFRQPIGAVFEMPLARSTNPRHLNTMRNNQRTAKAKAIALRVAVGYLRIELAIAASLVLLSLLLLSRP